jgi:DNA-directed RNA polymerase specialized sigma24 family protein
MCRDLIATILDDDADTFRVEADFVLPGGIGEIVDLARDARGRLTAAQELWQERAARATIALAREGYSLRETATLLSLSHQRVDQILRTQSYSQSLRRKTT